MVAMKVAVQVAKELTTIKEGRANRALLAKHAASRAAAVNLHARCQRCESCLAVGVRAAAFLLNCQWLWPQR